MHAAAAANILTMIRAAAPAAVYTQYKSGLLASRLVGRIETVQDRILRVYDVTCVDEGVCVLDPITLIPTRWSSMMQLISSLE